MKPLFAAALALLSAGSASAGTYPFFSPAGINGIRLCDPIDSVRWQAGSLRDTVIESEETSWKARIVRLPGGSEVRFEGAWTDSTRVWRFSTTDPAFRSGHGVHVGMTLADIVKSHVKAVVVCDENDAFLEIPDDGISALFEPGLPCLPQKDPSLKNFPPKAKVARLRASAVCP